MTTLHPLTQANVTILVKIVTRLQEGNCSELEQLIAAGIIYQHELVNCMLVNPSSEETQAALANCNALIINAAHNDYAAILELRIIVKQLNDNLSKELTKEIKKGLN